ncbi:MAG: hypothetical protein AB1481_04695 [Candidatus Omnitrophota bacterium]
MFKSLVVFLAALFCVLNTGFELVQAEELVVGEEAGMEVPVEAQSAQAPVRDRSAIQEKVRMWTEELGLTEEQQQQAREILLRMKEEIKQAPEGDMEARKEIRRKAHDDIAEILTPEQKAKFRELRQKQQSEKEEQE